MSFGFSAPSCRFDPDHATEVQANLSAYICLRSLPTYHMEANLDRNRTRVMVDELRPLVIDWLSSLRAEHACFPDNFLPAFPFASLALRKQFRWTPQITQRPHAYRVTFEFGGRSPTSSIFWRIRSGKWRLSEKLRFTHSPSATGNVVLGMFEVPPEICDNALRPFQPGADLVLEALQRSVAVQSTVGLVSSIEEQPVRDGAGVVPYPVEVFHFITLLDWRLRQRGIAARFLQGCVQCCELLPHPGPNLCPAHNTR